MRTPQALVTLLLLAAADAASASVSYAPADHAERIHQGAGGGHFARNGVDWWTSGAPARRFAVVGLLTDDRDSLALSGHALGSASVARVARVARSHGADGLLLHDARATPTCLPGQEYYCRNGRVRGRGEPVTRLITHLVAIRYL